MSELLNCPRSAGPFSSANNSRNVRGRTRCSRRLSASRTLSESGEAIGVHEAQSKTSRMGVVIMAQRNNCVLG
jgi:hypothetical protein